MGTTPPKEDLTPRRVRKHVWALPHVIDLRFPEGFATEVKAELDRILASPSQDYRSAPVVEGNERIIRVREIHFRHIFEVLFRMRTIRDALWQLGEKRVGGYAELKKGFAGVHWDLVLPERAKVALRVRSQGSRLFHERGIAEALGELLEKQNAKMVGHDEAAIVLECTLLENRMRLSLGCFGRPAYERGYKAERRSKAPLREDLAACLFERLRRLAPSAFAARRVLVPFAGSGTLGVEAWLAGADLPAGVFGRRYAWEDLPCASHRSNIRIRERVLRPAHALDRRSIVAIEHDPVQADALEKNLEFAHQALERLYPDTFSHSILRRDVFSCGDLEVPEEPSVVPLNPPYGMRLRAEKDLPSKLGRWLRKRAYEGAGFVLAAEPRDENRFLRELGTVPLAAGTVRSGGLALRGVFFSLHRTRSAPPGPE